MFRFCCQILSRSGSTFLKLNGNKLMLTSRNLYLSQAYQLLSPNTTSSLKNSDLRKINNRKRCYAFEDMLKRIEENEDNLKLISISETINNMYFYIHEKKKPHKGMNIRSFDELLKSKGFFKLLLVLQDHLLELSTGDLVTLFQSLYYAKIPLDSIIFMEVASRLIENQSRLTFIERSQVFCKLITCGNARIQNKAKNLEKDLIKNLQNLKQQVDAESASDILLTLIVIRYNFLSDELRAQVLEDVIGFSKCENFEMYRLFLFRLTSLPSTHPKYSSIKNIFFEKVKSHCSSDEKIYSNLLLYYCGAIKESDVEYRGELIDEIIHEDLKFTTNPVLMGHAGMALRFANHVNYEYLEYGSNLIRCNSSLLIENPDLYKKIIGLLADSNHNHEDRCRWSGILPFIRDSPALLNTLRIYQEEIRDHISLTVQLASLGIYDDSSLRFLSERINNRPEILTEIRERAFFFVRVAGLLNESVRVLRLSFSENFLSDNALRFIIDILKKLKYSSSGKDFLMDVQGCLDSVSETKNSILLPCFTKGGLPIDGIVAVNDKGELYSFSALISEKNTIFLEDIIVPQNFELITLSCLTELQYSRNTHSLKAFFSQRLKVFEAMGYPSLYILQHTWDGLDDKDKGKYLLDQIYKKRRNATAGIPLHPVDPTAC